MDFANAMSRSSSPRDTFSNLFSTVSSRVRTSPALSSTQGTGDGGGAGGVRFGARLLRGGGAVRLAGEAFIALEDDEARVIRLLVRVDSSSLLELLDSVSLSEITASIFISFLSTFGHCLRPFGRGGFLPLPHAIAL